MNINWNEIIASSNRLLCAISGRVEESRRKKNEQAMKDYALPERYRKQMEKEQESAKEEPID